jgi:hypothetical protein
MTTKPEYRKTFCKPPCTPIPLGDFKAVLGLDDREDALSRYCLTTASYTIGQRRLPLKRHFEWIAAYGDMLRDLIFLLPL